MRKEEYFQKRKIKKYIFKQKNRKGKRDFRAYENNTIIKIIDDKPIKMIYCYNKKGS